MQREKSGMDMRSKDMWQRMWTVVMLFVAGTVFGAEPEDNLHKMVLYTQVRVKVPTGSGVTGGSGTVIYSKPQEKDSPLFSTYVMTCHHVIEGAISLEDEFDPRIGKMRKRELKKEVTVEFFDYMPDGRVDRTFSVQATIEAYNKLHDMALLKLKSVQEAKYVAKLYPPNQETKVRVGRKTVAVGCALLHDPILTEGMITHKGDIIDYAEYWMSNANIIYGNSGGAMFTADTYEFLGIPSRVAVIGWSSPVSYMGYFSPITRCYKFFIEQGFVFLFDSSKTEAECLKENTARKEKAEQRE